MSEGGDDHPQQKVGYRQPPVSTRFQKGRSGNPGGRPRSKGPAVIDMAALLNAPIKLRRKGSIKSVAMKEAQLRAMLKEAMAGKLDAIAYCLQQFDEQGAIAMPELEQGGVVQIPKTMPIEMGSLLIRYFGRPDQPTAAGAPTWTPQALASARELYLATRDDDARKEDSRIGYPDLETR